MFETYRVHFCLALRLRYFVSYRMRTIIQRYRSRARRCPFLIDACFLR